MVPVGMAVDDRDFFPATHELSQSGPQRAGAAVSAADRQSTVRIEHTDVRARAEGGGNEIIESKDSSPAAYRSGYEQAMLPFVVTGLESVNCVVQVLCVWAR
ncbi:MAG: hypothetical protein H6Q33_5523 [Deltaproteobacteria bacterium]|nr:hypothetical protein [Deltaproteobacteria bacterium]